MTTATTVTDNRTVLRRFAIATATIAVAFGAGLAVDNVLSQTTERSQPRTVVDETTVHVPDQEQMAAEIAILQADRTNNTPTTPAELSDQEQMAAEIAILQADRTNNTPTTPAELSDQEQMAVEIAAFLQARIDWN